MIVIKEDRQAKEIQAKPLLELLKKYWILGFISFAWIVVGLNTKYIFLLKTPHRRFLVLMMGAMPFIWLLGILIGYLFCRYIGNTWKLTDNGIRSAGVQVGNIKWNKILRYKIEPINEFVGYTKITVEKFKSWWEAKIKIVIICGPCDRLESIEQFIVSHLQKNVGA